MIRILVVTHGTMAEGIVQSAQMFTGEAENVEYLCFKEEMGQEELEELIGEKMEGVASGDQMLVFCDILGGTPFNLCSKFSFNNENVSVFYGVNLPTLVQAILSREGQSLAELAASLHEVSKESIGISTL